MSERLIEPMIRPFRASDVEAIQHRDDLPVPKRIVIAQALAGPAFTACLEDRPVGCGGMMIPWIGVGFGWVLVGVEAESYGMWMTRTARRFLNDIVRRHRLHRVEVLVDPLIPRNQAWMRFLGFRLEQHGEAKSYLSTRGSMLRYERVQDEGDT